MNLEIVCNDVINLTNHVAEYIRKEREVMTSGSIESKGRHNFVTHVDKGSEERLVNGLKKIIPESGFIAEEGTSSEVGEIYNWVIDPIDGTTNFIHGAPPYSISIGLMEKTEVVLGIVFEISGSECFSGFKGSVVKLNGKQIKVSSVENVSDSLIATGFPYDNFNRLEPFMKTMDYFFYNSHGVRRLGSAAIDLAYVACGRYDAFYEYNLNPWDVAAGAFLVQLAGGRVSDFKGTDNFLFGKEIVASNALIFDQFQNIVGQFMNI
jgi:myo-inositol-1(or 4)-monophosphatase